MLLARRRDAAAFLIAALAALAAVRGAAEGPLKKHDDWPGDQRQLMFLWANAAATNQILLPGGKPGRTCRLVARGGARYHRFHDMDLAGGYVAAEDVDDELLAACRTSSELGIEAVITPASAAKDARGSIVSFSSEKSFNFVLYQAGERLALRMRTTAAYPGPPTTPGTFRGTKLTAGKCQHVIVTYRPGRLVCYVDGRQADAMDYRGKLTNWTKQHLLFGDDHAGGQDWAGRLEGIAIYSRFVGAAEAKQKYSLYAPHLAKREPARRVVLDGRLAEITPTPSPKAVGAYRRCLVVYRYDVAKVVTGRCEARQVLVAHWGILDRKVVQIGKQTGKTYRLTLEPFDDHPQLESERRVSAIEDVDLPLFYDVARRASAARAGRGVCRPPNRTKA